MTPSEHPERETLWRFGLGRLDRKRMMAVENHLRQCPQCGRVALRAPDDRLVTLLRVSAPDGASGPSPRSSSATRPSRALGMIVLGLGLGSVLSFSLAGCSGGGKAAAFSPEDQAKAKAAFQKRFDGGGGKQMVRKVAP